MTKTLERHVDIYCAAWSLKDADRRLADLCSVLDAHCVYSDPSVRVIGIEALSHHIAHIQTVYPQARIVRTSRIDAHHAMFRFGWQMVFADGTALPEGIDIVDMNDNGQWMRISGFFGALKKP